MLVIAANAHDGQFDKGGMPYILHPLKVMHYLKTTDEELMCIALGHDLLEDTPISANYLESMGFSSRVIDGIKCLTKHSDEDYEDYKKRVMSNKDAMLVKMADLRHNTDLRRLKGISDKDVARVAKYHVFYTEIKAKLNET